MQNKTIFDQVLILKSGCLDCLGLFGFADVALAELCAVDQPEAQRDDTGGQEDDRGGLLSDEYPAAEGGEDWADEPHEGDEGGRKSFKHHPIEVVADDVRDEGHDENPLGEREDS